ncbi:SH3 domain-containing protein [Prosthecomicrobium hirschii]|uniref:SH3 domain-containing protein n=1 Tax=Prosthecodimorpha hirschii TaxID=665126 RepID=UPI002220BA83|nr:SH3 domain-containing protein [Prosthecomicrobium hirschii]
MTGCKSGLSSSLLIAGLALLGAVAATSGPASAQSVPTGPSGLQLPRFASMKSHPVNIRVGPSRDYDIAWTFTRSGIPVEITQEFDVWYRVRDSEGQEGWVQKSFLSGKRTALIAPWEKSGSIPMRARPDNPTVVANVEPNVQVEVANCDGTWCKVTVERYSGYVEQQRLWGVYPKEKYPVD